MTVRNMICRIRSKGQAGFTILEVLVATVIFSIALVALSSVSFTVLGGNKHSGKFVQATILAQEQIEIIRAMGGFSLGADMLLGTADDVIPAQLANTSTANDATTDPETMFGSPDYTQNGNATPLTLTTTPQAAWLIRDNYPIAGMKSVSVVVGWKEGTAKNFIVVSTAMQGQ